MRLCTNKPFSCDCIHDANSHDCRAKYNKWKAERYRMWIEEKDKLNNNNKKENK